MARKKTPVTVLAAVDRDLADIGKLDKALETSALAAAARALAAELDDASNSATSKSMCARELREHLDRLRELAPPKREADGVDDLADKRAKRRSTVRGADAPDQARP